jgi:hypothetical protein
MSILDIDIRIMEDPWVAYIVDPAIAPVKITRELLKSREDLRRILCLMWDKAGGTYSPVPGLSLVFPYRGMRYTIDTIDFVEVMESGEISETGTIDPNYVERDSLDYLQQKRE